MNDWTENYRKVHRKVGCGHNNSENVFESTFRLNFTAEKYRFEFGAARGFGKSYVKGVNFGKKACAGT